MLTLRFQTLYTTAAAHAVSTAAIHACSDAAPVADGSPNTLFPQGSSECSRCTGYASATRASPRACRSSADSKSGAACATPRQGSPEAHDYLDPGAPVAPAPNSGQRPYAYTAGLHVTHGYELAFSVLPEIASDVLGLLAEARELDQIN